MGASDKIENSAEKAKGKVTEGVGHVTGDEDKVAEGRAEQSKADLKQAAEKVKDVFKD